MPSIGVDWTINGPTLIALIGVLISVVTRFTKLETLLSTLTTAFEKHCEEDDERFKGERESRHHLSDRVQTLAVEQARQGAAAAQKGVR